ncbi:fibronectin type III domain protein [Fontibacillus phaseoli]|uniref:Fibronectin type III domain protein n=1 Tax=Fontibacillus phaseoli TaxID=1416533 RepID=A0A369BJA4_9BACL|nr:fibronectin type III domain-containing protein [Fontibacillus phaseoli]RCX21679.1 fibronectin type III domain protein [Fontibacillus phaseoli]
MQRSFGLKRIKVILVIVLIFTLCSGGMSGPLQVSAAGREDTAKAAYVWGQVPIGGGGYVTGIMIHPKEPDLVYIRSDVGGIFRWNEENQSWKQLIGDADRQHANLYGGESIALDPSDPNIIYAALGRYDYLKPSDIYKSTDRGENWSPTGLTIGGKEVRMSSNGQNRAAGERLAVDPNNGNIVYFGSRYDGLFRSTKAAEQGSWIQVASFPSLNNQPLGISFVQFDPSSGSKETGSAVIYAGAYNSGVYVSHDAGATWTLLPGGPQKPNRAAVSKEGTLYVAHGQGLAKYEGGVWADITPSGDLGQPFGSIAVDPADSKTLMTARRQDAHGNPIYRSTDGGATWAKLQTSRNVLVPWMPSWHWSSATSALAYDPFHPGRVWLTDWYYAWRTDDVTAAPSKWSNHAKGLETVVNVANLVSPPHGNKILHSGIADNGGFDHHSLESFPVSTYFTSTGGIKELTTTGIDVSASRSDFVVRVGTYGWNGDGRSDPGGGGYSNDGGDSYTAFGSLPFKGVQGGKTAVSATYSNNVVWMPQKGSVYYTMDLGDSWMKSAGLPDHLITGDHIFASYYQPLASDKVKDGMFYAYDYKAGKFFRSNNGGRSFDAVSGLPSQQMPWHHVQAAPGIMGEVWVSLNDKGLYRSSNGGSQFERVKNVEHAFLFSFGKEAPGMLNPAVFVFGKVTGFPGEAIYRSDDMGVTWVKASVSDPFPGNEPNSMAGDMQVHGRVYVGTNGSGILYGEPSRPLSPAKYNDNKAPKPPKKLKITATGTSFIDLSWDHAADSDSGMRGYRISNTAGEMLAETYGTSYSFSGLHPGEKYTFLIQAVDLAGNLSRATKISAKTESADVTPPQTPEEFQAEALSYAKIQLSWKPNAEGEAVGYQLYRSTEPEFIAGPATRIAYRLPGDNYLDASGLEPGTVYYYKLSAVDEVGNESPPSREIRVETPVDQRLDIIVDNRDPGFSVEGGWQSSTYSASRYGEDYMHDGREAGKRANWTPNLPQAGEYNVYMLWNASPNRTSKAGVEIIHDEGSNSEVTVNQTQNDNQWVWLGKYRFGEGSAGSVTIRTAGDETTIADAVKFSLAADDPFGETHPR